MLEQSSVNKYYQLFVAEKLMDEKLQEKPVCGKPLLLSPEDEKENRFCRKVLIWVLAIWGVFWTLLPLILLEGLYFDVLENLEWGRYWQFGYDKHPFVSMWITRAVYEMTGEPAWLYLLNQISVFLAVLCVWLLARRVLRPLPALAATLMTLTLQYFSSWALEFNNDVIAVSVWAAAMLFCYRAVVGQKITDWLLTAFFCFLAVMTKYYAALLVGLLGLAVLCHKTGRKSFRHAGLYTAAVFFLLLILPNVIWLFNNDFLPFDYAMQSSTRKEVTGIMRNLTQSWSFFMRMLERLGFFIPVFLVLFGKRERPENRIRTEGFDRFYFTLIGLGPLGFTLLLPLLGGLHIKMTWLASCFSFLAVWLFMVLNPVVTRRRILLLVIFLGLYGFGLGFHKTYSALWKQPYRDRSCPYHIYPGKPIAEKAEEIWSRNVPNRPLKYVIAPREEGSSLSYYVSTRPHSCYFYDFRISPWCSKEDLEQSGALVAWEMTSQSDGSFESKPPKWLKALPKDRLVMAGHSDFDRLVRPWFRCHVKEPVRKIRIAFAVLLPSSSQPKSAR